MGGGEEIRVLVVIEKCVEHNRQRFIFKKKERKKKLKIKYGRRSIRRARVENTREKRTREKKADSLSTSFLWDQGEANGTCSRAPFPIIFSLYF